MIPIPRRRPLLFLPVLVALLFIVSIYIISKQDLDTPLPSFHPQLSPEKKLTSIEQALLRRYSLNSSITPWPSPFPISTTLPSSPLLQSGVLPKASAKCLPLGLGYTKLQSDTIFDPLTQYPNCSALSPNIIKANKTHLIKTCNNSFISLGLDPKDELFGRVPYNFSWSAFNESINTDNREYAFVKCGKIRQAATFLKYIPDAAERAKNITKNLEASMNITESKPLTVFMLIFDSLSRFHMYRNFNKTLSFLNSSIVSGELQNDFVMYDFLINHAHGENTIPNMIPYLFGYSFKYHKLRLANYDYLDPKDNQAFVDIQKDSIWKHFESMGFVTMFGFDIIWDFLVPAVGRKIKTDHIFTNFWKGASKVFGSDNYINKHSCFGSEHSHNYMFTYIKDYLKAYKGINRFGYTHVTTAHEKSGTIIKTVDDDLLRLMQEILSDYAQSKEDIVFIIAGDHGKHVSETDFVKEGWLENMLPGQLVIANKDLISKLGADANLRYNTKKLVSRGDWHMTLKHLSTVPYGNLYRSSSLYKNWKQSVDSPYSVSLLMEKVQATRTCKDMDIEEYFCVCLPFKEYKHNEIINNSHLNLTVKLALEYVNKNIKSPICQRLTLSEITYAAIREIESDYTIYRIRFTVEQNIKVMFEVYASLYSSNSPHYKREGIEVVDVPQESIKIQILKVVRIDEYVGYMEEICVEIKEKPSFCIPKLPSQITEKDLKNKEIGNLFKTMVSMLTFRLAELNSTCVETCQEYDSVCQPWGIMIMSRTDIIQHLLNDQFEMKIFTSRNQSFSLQDNADHIEEGGFFGYYNDNLVLSIEEYTCDIMFDDAFLICPCK